jgi:hypothetical protein
VIVERGRISPSRSGGFFSSTRFGLDSSLLLFATLIGIKSEILRIVAANTIATDAEKFSTWLTPRLLGARGPPVSYVTRPFIFFQNKMAELSGQT